MRQVWLGLLALTLFATPAGPAEASWPIRPTVKHAKPQPKLKPPAKVKPKCSATGINVHPIVPLKAPPKVRAMHVKILEAAASCDYLALERLALAGRQKFDFTFGDSKKPAAYWQGLEKKGDPFLKRLIRIMKTDFGRDGKVYVWPAAAARSANEEDWELLIPLFGEREMKIFRDYGGYTDIRLAIVDDGDWIYCIDGD